MLKWNRGDTRSPLLSTPKSSMIARMFPQKQQSHTISRSDRYNLVWSEQMVKVATRFHVSDVAVAKACRRHKVPLPGRGYWARVAAGQQVEKVPLPATKEGWLETITFAVAKPLYGTGRWLEHPSEGHNVARTCPEGVRL